MAALGDAYYADPDMIRDAITRRASFNLVHRATMTSERQWADVLGVLRVQPKLDEAYLDTWADLLDVTALLARARRER